MLPRARKKDLIVEPLDDETLIYDLKTDRAHCLNKTATLVWRYCDGKTDVTQMARKIATQTKSHVAGDIIELAIQRLVKVNLIEKSSVVKGGPVQTRRNVIKTIGKVAGLSLPLITSINAPAAVNTASCVGSTVCTVLGRVKACCCPATKGAKGLLCVSSIVKGKTTYSCTGTSC